MSTTMLDHGFVGEGSASIRSGDFPLDKTNIRAVQIIVSDDTIVITNWRNIKEEFLDNAADALTIDQHLERPGNIQIAILKTLQMWVGRNGPNATFDACVKIFSDLNYNFIAQKLEDERESMRRAYEAALSPVTRQRVRTPTRSAERIGNSDDQGHDTAETSLLPSSTHRNENNHERTDSHISRPNSNTNTIENPRHPHFSNLGYVLGAVSALILVGSISILISFAVQTPSGKETGLDDPQISQSPNTSKDDNLNITTNPKTATTEGSPVPASSVEPKATTATNSHPQYLLNLYIGLKNHTTLPCSSADKMNMDFDDPKQKFSQAWMNGCDGIRPSILVCSGTPKCSQLSTVLSSSLQKSLQYIYYSGVRLCAEFDYENKCSNKIVFENLIELRFACNRDDCSDLLRFWRSCTKYPKNARIVMDDKFQSFPMYFRLMDQLQRAGKSPRKNFFSR